MVKVWRAWGRIALSNVGGGGWGEVNPHRLLVVDKWEVILPKPIEFKVMNAKGELVSTWSSNEYITLPVFWRNKLRLAEIFSKRLYKEGRQLSEVSSPWSASSYLRAYQRLSVIRMSVYGYTENCAKDSIYNSWSVNVYWMKTPRSGSVLFFLLCHNYFYILFLPSEV